MRDLICDVINYDACDVIKWVEMEILIENPRKIKWDRRIGVRKFLSTG